MRPMAPAILTLLLVLSLAPLPAASAAAEGAPLSSDAAGDVRAGAYGGGTGTSLPAPMPAGAADFVDVTELAFLETEDELRFTFSIVDLSGGSYFAGYNVGFDWQGVEYRANLFHSAFADYSYAALFEVVDEGRWEFIVELEGAVDKGAGTVEIVLPRVYVLDGDDRSPQKGDALVGLDAFAAQYQNLRLGQLGTMGASFYDAVPDEGELEVTLALGGEANGHLRVASPEPVRVSNGGATTFVFQLDVENTGAVDDEVALSVSELPEDWRAEVQSPVRVAAGETKTVPVLASVPFKHEHGGVSMFRVEARSSVQPDVTASNRLGVLHTPVPQPAGHHPDIFLHAQPWDESMREISNTRSYLNTDADHSNDAAGATANWFYNGPGWRFDLEPGLRMGLDFRLGETGALVGSITGNTEQDATVSARLVLVEGTERDAPETVLATSSEVDVRLTLEGSTPFELTLEPTEDADYVPYAKEQNLRLYVELDHLNILCCMQKANPVLDTETFKLSLPLDEYHDRLSAAPGLAAGGLELRADGPQAKSGSPGALLTYAFVLKNTGEKEEVIQISTAGTDAELGEVAPAGDVTLAPGEERRVTLGVRLPGDASEGEAFEVLVFARAQSDPSISAVGRTQTTVAFGDAAQADESAVFAAAQEDANETPAAGALAALAVLGVAALAMRRRA